MAASKRARIRWLELLESFHDCPIGVYGDLIADEFVYGEISRVSREAPVLVLNYRQSRIVPGGAANAINNLRALGARPIPLGILGRDVTGNALRKQFRKAKIPLSLVREVRGYQTPTKTRYSAGSTHSSRQQVLRIDRGTGFSHTPNTIAVAQARLRELRGRCRALIVSDYGYGFVTPEVVQPVLCENQSIPVTLDSRFSLMRFSGFTGCTPNEPEVEAALNITIGNNISKLEQCGKALLKRLRLKSLLITRGKDGMTLFVARKNPVHIPIFGSDEIADVTGAGDTVIAVFTLALACGASFYEAARLSNYAGGLVVMKEGTATVSTSELMIAIEADVGAA